MNTDTSHPPSHVTRILVPIDSSEESRSAVEYAAVLGQKFHADVDLVHVWKSNDERMRDADPNDPSAGVPRSELLGEFARTDAGHQMRDRLRELEQHGIDAHGRLALGDALDPSEVIVHLAEEEAYDLIVMATHGRTWLFKSGIAEKVVRRATCPVVTIRADLH